MLAFIFNGFHCFGLYDRRRKIPTRNTFSYSSNKNKIRFIPIFEFYDFLRNAVKLKSNYSMQSNCWIINHFESTTIKKNLSNLNHVNSCHLFTHTIQKKIIHLFDSILYIGFVACHKFQSNDLINLSPFFYVENWQLIK